MKLEKIILGIDPGYGLTGFGLIKVAGQKLTCLEVGVIETKAGLPFSDRIATLHHELKKIIRKNKPDMMAVEDLFFYKNLKTAIKVGQARGVIILTAVLEKIPVVEYTPLQVKQAISSYGRASKDQVGQMVKVLLGLKCVPKPDDAADALAVAICAANSIKFSDKIKINL